MMRRRGGTNKLKHPKKDKSKGQVAKKKANVDISGDVSLGSSTLEHAGAGASEVVLEESHSSSVVETPGPSTLVRQGDSFGDFVFKRPKTPPPKTPKRGIITSGTSLPESRRIRSKLKPGKTGFPIGASLHGLSRSEKLERRSKGKSRTNSSGAFPEVSQSTHHQSAEGNSDNAFATPPSLPTEERQKGGRKPEPVEQVISYPRQTVTKLKFPPPRQRSASEKRSKRAEDLLEQQGIKESLEICQGFSKIKIDDWYPLFDFHHSKRSAPQPEVSTSSEKSAEYPAEKDGGEDDDEWEESLVYVDLEDIPDVEGMFSSLAARRRMTSSGKQSENEGEGSLSHLEMKIFNLDSDLPVLLLGGKYLAGHWENPCGTSLFFKKKSEGGDDLNHSSSSSSGSKPDLKNVVPEPEISYDPIFGKNYGAQQEDGYELVAKSMKVLKARYFPVVNEELKGEDVIRDADDEFDHRDFQIPPVNMVREFLPSNFSYEDYKEKEIERRKQIRERWGDDKDNPSDNTDTSNIVKTEPLDHEDEYTSDDTEDLDSILILSSEESNEPIPGTSRGVNG